MSMSSEFSGAGEIYSQVPLFESSTSFFPFCSSPRGIKLKRSRQRVDAGQPRNSYTWKSSASSPTMSTTPFASSPSSRPFDPSAAPSPFASLFHSPQMNAFYRLQQQALLSSSTASAFPPDENLKREATNNNTPVPVPTEESHSESNGNDTKACDACVDQDGDPEEGEEVAAKKSRVENIISGIHSAPPSPGTNADTSGSADVNDEPRSISVAGSESSPRSKRKQYEPKKETNGTPQETTTDGEDVEDKEKTDEPVVERVQHLFELQRRQYFEWLTAQQKAKTDAGKEGEAEQSNAEDLRQNLKAGSGAKELSGLATSLKTELLSTLSATVDRIMGDYMEKEAARFQAQMRAVEANRSQAAVRASNPAYSLFNPYYGAAALGAYGANFPHFTASSTASNASIFPGSFAPSQYSAAIHNNPFSPDSASRKDHFSLMNLSKRKRSKVTDTRLGGRLGLKEEGSRGSPNGYYPPTMVGHPLYGATLPPGLDDLRDVDSPTFSDDLSYESGPVDPNIPQSTTLTPMHLRKAKLMFFYTRYPSSTLIKTYFPDIRFNKNTTAQLVKWFSNFREFYYIQMEKFARQAMAEGIRRPEDIHVSTEGDLYKTLNQHYNRNNHIQVPTEFRAVVEATLREFFLSVQAGKDAESSWKKQIYKVIARLDTSIPDYFKNPHFLDQLE